MSIIVRFSLPRYPQINYVIPPLHRHTGLDSGVFADDLDDLGADKKLNPI